MKKLYLFLIISVFSVTVFAQTVPILPKEWKGEVSGTSRGVAHQMNPNQDAKEWNTFDEPRTLTILRQEGRHLEALLKKYPRGQARWVGTISKDGKRLDFGEENASFSFTLSGDTLSGCGVGRGNNGSFDHYFNNYAVLCFDFTAVK